MKLIDILIENNVQWPEGAEGAVQDLDGEVKFYAGKEPIIEGGVWVRNRYTAIYGNCSTETASDYGTAIITKQEWENRKVNKKAMFADVEIGDNVWDSQHGWGVVYELEHSFDYPIHVDFGHHHDSYTLHGYCDEEDVNPALFWDEIEIKAPPKPAPKLPKLEVDTEVIVWDSDGEEFCRHFSHFSKDGVLHAFVDGKTSFTSGGVTSLWHNWELAE